MTAGRQPQPLPGNGGARRERGKEGREASARTRGSSALRLGEARQRTVALVGQPNTGKTTLFNALTGQSQHVGNWPGKTVERAEGRMALPLGEATLVDLPGTYALSGGSVEEELAWGFILDEVPDAVVVVAEATRIRRGLRLFLQVRELTPRVVLAVTMVDEARRAGAPPALDALAAALGAPVVGLVAPKGEGLEALAAAVERVIGNPVVPVAAPYPPGVEIALLQVERALDAVGVGGRSGRWLALRLLDLDGAAAAWVVARGGAAAVAAAHRVAEPFGSGLSEQVSRSLTALARRLAAVAGPVVADERTERVDRVVLHPLLALPLVLAVFGAIFWLTVVGATPISAWLTVLFNGLSNSVRGWLAGAPWWLAGPVAEGLVHGVGTVIAVMLPTMAIFFVLFALLEDSGLIPRIAFTMDRVMRSVGGQGKQCVSCMMAYGCNIPGVLSTRIMRGRDRLVAILTNSLNPCNGRLGGMVVLSALFFGRRAALAMTALVVVSWVVVYLATWGLNRLLKGEERSPFLIELPPYRAPDWRRVVGRALRTQVFSVLWRAAAVAAPFTVAIWFLSNLPRGAPFAATYTGQLVAALDPVGAPFGLDGAMLGALAFAIPAKEIMVASLAVTYGQAADLAAGGALEGAGLGAFLVARWSGLSAFCFLLFYMLYLPCAYTTVVIWRETRSWAYTALSQAVPLLAAFAVTLIFWRAGLALGYGAG